MGRGGIDVAREASDIVLTDDNFVSITAAIEEGRVTFGNVRAGLTSLFRLSPLSKTPSCSWPRCCHPRFTCWR